IGITKNLDYPSPTVLAAVQSNHHVKKHPAWRKKPGDFRKQFLTLNATPIQVQHALEWTLAHEHYSQRPAYSEPLKVMYPLLGWLHLWPVLQSVGRVPQHSFFQK